MTSTSKSMPSPEKFWKWTEIDSNGKEKISKNEGISRKRIPIPGKCLCFPEKGEVFFSCRFGHMPKIPFIVETLSFVRFFKESAYGNLFIFYSVTVEICHVTPYLSFTWP